MKGGSRNSFSNNRNKNFKTSKKPFKKETEESSNNQDATPEDEEESEKLDIWFDNVDPILLEETHVKKETKPDSFRSSKKPAENTLVKEESSDG